MSTYLVPILLFALFATALSAGLPLLPRLLGPHRRNLVKQMPYESGMDPLHDARRRFDVRFHLVAIAFLLFDVELLFLYPWAVANHPDNAQGFARIAGEYAGFSPGLVFVEVLVFIALLTVGFVYAWRKGVFQWR